MKKILFIIILLLPFTTQNVHANIFNDVNKEDYFFESVNNLMHLNILNEESDGKFEPYKELTRLDALLAIKKVNELIEPTNYQEVINRFKDVKLNHPYVKEIAAVVNTGIFQGSNGNLNLSKTLTREQMATILVRSFELENHMANFNPTLIKDYDQISNSHRQNVRIFFDLKITTGIEPGVFNPREDVNKAQFATFLFRLMEYENKIHIPINHIINSDNTIQIDNLNVSWDKENSLNLKFNQSFTNHPYLTVGLTSERDRFYKSMNKTKNGYEIKLQDIYEGTYTLFIGIHDMDGNLEVIFKEKIILE